MKLADSARAAGREQKPYGLVVGLGKSGLAAASALLALGGKADLYDQKPLGQLDGEALEPFRAAGGRLWLGGAEPEDFRSYHLVVASPGVPPTHPLLVRAREAGVEIIGEVELAYRYGRGSYVAITGTNGKTTTTTLTGELFRAAGLPVEVVGNIGTPIADRATTATDETWFVAEISSFQLETVARFRPRVSALLNLTPDHLDRHRTMEHYARAKARIFMNQTPDDWCVINLDDPLTAALIPECPAQVMPFSRLTRPETGCFVQDGNIVVRESGGRLHPICPAADLRIPGTHNLENALAATAMAFCAGVAPPIIGRVLRTFPGVAHRLEDCGMVAGVRYVNDSKGTNPDASIKAIEATTGNVRLIAGGYDKNSSFEQFVGAFGSKVKQLILLGKTAPIIRAAAEEIGFDNIVMVNSMEEAVQAAAGAADEGDTVLLSPACASWDMYRCFEERGDHFKQCVRRLTSADGA